jgi:DNA modification methylase
MTDFKSELEPLAPCKELLFNGTPGFGRYASLLSHSVGHPAKMNTRLTEFLILELTKPGELVLDPMSGTAQTGLIASVNSRDAVCVELEAKFHNWQLEAQKKLEAYQTFTVKGSLSCIQGDARKLSKLLEKVDCVVTSPPYSDMKKGKLDPEDWANKMEKFGSTPDSRRERHTPGRLKGAQSMSEGYSENPNNIGNLPIGEIDSIITSPPYGKDVVPHTSLRPGDTQEVRGYSENPENIGNLPIDAIITSPPYEKTIKDHGKSDRATKINIEKNNTSSFSYNVDNPENIGNKSKETYLQAMLQVYSEMFSVLKNGGVAAVIVKPFIRNRKVIDLPFQTWILMQKCGFQLTKIYKQRLDQQSFWRVLYMQKNPEVPQIWHEWVLVCVKPLEALD